MAEDVELVAAGELGQFGNSLGDEGRSLIRAALPIRFFGTRLPIPASARSGALPAAPWLAQKNLHPNSRNILQEYPLWRRNSRTHFATSWVESRNRTARLQYLSI